MDAIAIDVAPSSPVAPASPVPVPASGLTAPSSPLSCFLCLSSAENGFDVVRVEGLPCPCNVYSHEACWHTWMLNKVTGDCPICRVAVATPPASEHPLAEYLAAERAAFAAWQSSEDDRPWWRHPCCAVMGLLTTVVGIGIYLAWSYHI